MPSRSSLSVALLLFQSLVACAHDPPAASAPSSPEPASPAFTQPVPDAQARVNEYFQRAASTTLFKDCWSRIQGEGLLRLAFHYEKADLSWTFESLATETSSLPKGQEAVAQQCLEAALAGSSFAVNADNQREKATEAFALHWTWPVPMPSTKEEMAARMVGTGDGADVPGCSECVTRTEYPYGLKCVARESGGNLDCREHETNVCSWSPTTCLRGSFGMKGGVVMF